MSYDVVTQISVRFASAAVDGGYRRRSAPICH
jgi:hypothetical protein